MPRLLYAPQGLTLKSLHPSHIVYLCALYGSQNKDSQFLTHRQFIDFVMGNFFFTDVSLLCHFCHSYTFIQIG